MIYSRHSEMPDPLPTYTYTPGIFKQISRKVWTFQRTFQTPLGNLEPFVSAILSRLEPTTRYTTVIDGYVFDPDHMRGLLSAYPLSIKVTHDWSIESIDHASTKKLLVAMFQDWIDFIFLPKPQPFCFYADHDEYTTFYAMTKSNLNQAVQPLLSYGFIEVKDFERVF